MSAPTSHAQRVVRACLLLTFLIHLASATSAQHAQINPNKHDSLPAKQIELFDGVTVKIPEDNNATNKVMSFEIDTNKGGETGRSKQKKLLQRILPMFIVPFLIQSTIVPFFLSMLKFMLFKSLMVGKLALGLILINAFKNHNSVKGRHDSEMASVHYGYQGNGMEEYGAYVN